MKHYCREPGVGFHHRLHDRQITWGGNIISLNYECAKRFGCYVKNIIDWNVPFVWNSKSTWTAIKLRKRISYTHNIEPSLYPQTSVNSNETEGNGADLNPITISSKHTSPKGAFYGLNSLKPIRYIINMIWSTIRKYDDKTNLDVC